MCKYTIRLTVRFLVSFCFVSILRREVSSALLSAPKLEMLCCGEHWEALAIPECTAATQINQLHKEKHTCKQLLPSINVVFSFLKVLQFFHPLDELFIQRPFTLPSVVEMRPTSPFNEILSFCRFFGWVRIISTLHHFIVGGIHCCYCSRLPNPPQTMLDNLFNGFSIIFNIVSLEVGAAFYNVI